MAVHGIRNRHAKVTEFFSPDGMPSANSRSSDTMFPHPFRRKSAQANSAASSPL
jgi:hypothetical protein